MKQNEVMRLRENCSFSIDNVADMASLQEDVESLFVKSLDSESPSPKLFISYLVTYFDNRPKIISCLSPSKELNVTEFSTWMANMHIKAVTIKKIIDGEIVDEEIIKQHKDDLREVMKMMDRTKSDEHRVGIKRVKTGVVLRDTVEETRKELEDANLAGLNLEEGMGIA